MITQLVQAALTILAGVLVYVIGQLVVKFLIEPLSARSKLLGEIADSLIYYANASMDIQSYYMAGLKSAQDLEEPEKQIVGERYEHIIDANWQRCQEASDTLRRQASQLMSATYAIPLYSLWARLRWLPTHDDVIKASADLIGMSNAMTSGREHNHTAEIAKLLQIKVLAQRYGAK